jgi:Na+-transporting methylmalonyl-CoA/oxaloacetate decarboxylase gamma subunit
MGTLWNGLVNQSMVILSKSLSGKMNTALLNTLLGMGIVFSVLIFISIIIYLFRIFPYLQSKMSESSHDTRKSVDNVISQIVESEEDLVDDFELVAVITAAIYASMEGKQPLDGFIVRSIRKKNNRKITY